MSDEEKAACKSSMLARQWKGRRITKCAPDGGKAPLPILKIIAETPELTLAPEETAAICAAFDSALLELGLADRQDPLTRLVAEKIIAAARSGERNPHKIKQTVLDQLGAAPRRS